ncbi:interactor of constitutive active ROPs 4-like isoform X1 [Hibiscus syriacus]|uniref:interactor of constitutive active ROPs 4-like isoform X1 n=1 Tax=Hibiscus syriacus TaxID=106335 RepID=UPI00192186F6|nr:interactor of constitutive active ROPs 4-like isoform X1 [Hibiscus syriacus]XP_039001661.1 interactor of constitutive active ROPs 4-like isoform X1 [Hibiscus syriacus]XP_039001662.1 interactor of constitutive active ROPs 4-like isoform X1 [Hibiscus syriacus]
MPRSRGSEMPTRQSPRGTHQVKSSSSDSDPLHHRPVTDRISPKVGDRRFPRGASQSDPLNQKKLGTRIADLESQLGQAQEELKILKDQLVSAEAAKKEAQQELENKTKKPKAPESVEPNEKISPKRTRDNKKSDCSIRDEVPDYNQRETDVFEVPVEKAVIESKVEVEEVEQAEEKNKAIETSIASPAESELEKPSLHDLATKYDEMNMLKYKLEEKEKGLSLFTKENENLKKQLNEATSNISNANAKEEEMSLKLGQVGKEMEASKKNLAQLKEKLQSVEEQKEALEAEMKKLRVQTEQWRKAADAAAAILSGGMEMNGRISNRCSSMDKHFGGVFETPVAGGFAGYVGSPALGDEIDDGFGSGKRKGSGIKMFGDLWKKKSQK